MTPKVMTPQTLKQFITDLDYCDLDEVRALHQHADHESRSYETTLSLKPMWRDMARLLAREISRY